MIKDGLKQEGIWTNGELVSDSKDHSSEEQPLIISDREIMLEAVKKWGLSLEYASDNLKNDRALVYIAIKDSGDALQYASDALKADRDLVL